VSATQQFVSESKVSDRIDVVAADLTAGIPEGTYDLAILRYVVQTKSPEQAKTLLTNVGRSLRPNGMILVVGSLVDDTRLYPEVDAAVRGLLMLNNYEGGHAYTESELRGWLVEAEFRDVAVEFEAIPDKSTVVTAHRA